MKVENSFVQYWCLSLRWGFSSMTYFAFCTIYLMSNNDFGKGSAREGVEVTP